MKIQKICWTVVLSCLFIGLALGDDAGAPFGFGSSYSVKLVGMGKDGITIENKINYDVGKIRSEFTEKGQHLIFIILPEEQRVYKIVPDQKVVIENRYYPHSFEKLTEITSRPVGRWSAIGSEVIEGTECKKYKIITPDGKVYFWWIDGNTKIPMEMTSEDGELTLLWKDYKDKPQDPSLFKLPLEYHLVKIGVPMPNAITHLPGQ